jgi:hypothetical protein
MNTQDTKQMEKQLEETILKLDIEISKKNIQLNDMFINKKVEELRELINDERIYNRI